MDVYTEENFPPPPYYIIQDSEDNFSSYRYEYSQQSDLETDVSQQLSDLQITQEDLILQIIEPIVNIISEDNENNNKENEHDNEQINEKIRQYSLQTAFTEEDFFPDFFENSSEISPGYQKEEVEMEDICRLFFDPLMNHLLKTANMRREARCQERDMIILAEDRQNLQILVKRGKSTSNDTPRTLELKIFNVSGGL